MTLVLDETRPVARKTHFCDVCLGTIGVGDQYLRQRNVGDDGPYVFKAHRLCWAISLRVNRENGGWEDDWPEPLEVRAEIAAIFEALALPREDQK